MLNWGKDIENWVAPIFKLNPAFPAWKSVFNIIAFPQAWTLIISTSWKSTSMSTMRKAYRQTDKDVMKSSKEIDIYLWAW